MGKNEEGELTLRLESESDRARMLDLSKGLSSPVRLDILNLLYIQPRTIPELSKILEIPPSSLEFHIRQMESCGLIQIKYAPEKKGFVRVCCGNLSVANFLFCETDRDIGQNKYKASSGVGMYMSFECGGERGIATADAAYRNDEADYNAGMQVLFGYRKEV